MSSAKRKDPPEQLYADSRRASGKRYRQKRDPNSWSSSILTIRSNILLLGMSYPSVTKAIEQFNLSSKVHIQHPEPSVEQAIELVRRRILGTIDGRDYARIKALEASNEKLAYTVSKEKGGPYELKRHLDADFNSRTFIKEMADQWGVGFGCNPIQFQQVILDYYWIPPGTWQTMHWKPSFFRDNLPNFVSKKMFFYGCLSKDVRHIRTTNEIEGGDYVTSDAGVIYLPFCENCFVEIVACSSILSKVFTISFMLKDDLEEHTLWKATNTISAASMQDWLEKKLDQEEEYCKLTRQKLAYGSAIGSNHVDRDAVLDIFDRIDRVEDVRMIKLTALRENHPEFKQSGITWFCKRGVNIGGFVGLLKSPRATKIKLPSTATAKRYSANKSATPLKASSRTEAAIPSEAEIESFINQIVTLILTDKDAVELLESGSLKIKRLDLLDDILFGGFDGFEKELKRHGWKRRNKYVWYHSELQSTQIQSLLDVRNDGIATAKKQTATAQDSKTASRLSIDDANNSGLVLSHEKSSAYREVLFGQFRSMVGIQNPDKDNAARKVLQMLKQSSVKQFFKWDHNKRICYAVTEEEALKKIKSDILNRNRQSLKHQWIPSSTPTRLVSQRRHSPRLLPVVGSATQQPLDKGTDLLEDTKLADSSSTDQEKTSEDSVAETTEMLSKDSLNDPGVVLDYSNTLYEAVMFHHFQKMMTDKKLNPSDVSQMVLRALKEVASDSSQFHKKECSTAPSGKLYLWNHRRRNTRSATDEEALKKISNDISRRNETEIASKWVSFSSHNRLLPSVVQNKYDTHVVSHNMDNNAIGLEKDYEKGRGIKQPVPNRKLRQRQQSQQGSFETSISTPPALHQDKPDITHVSSSPTTSNRKFSLANHSKKGPGSDQSRKSKYMLRKREYSRGVSEFGKRTNANNKSKSSTEKAASIKLTNSFSEAMSECFVIQAKKMLSKGETSHLPTLSSDDSDMSSCRVDSDTYATTVSSEPPLTVETNNNANSNVAAAELSLQSEDSIGSSELNSTYPLSRIDSDTYNIESNTSFSREYTVQRVETTSPANEKRSHPQAVAVYGIGCSNMRLFR